MEIITKIINKVEKYVFDEEKNKSDKIGIYVYELRNKIPYKISISINNKIIDVEKYRNLSVVSYRYKELQLQYFNKLIDTLM